MFDSLKHRIVPTAKDSYDTNCALLFSKNHTGIDLE
jgi:hypothetical protein